MRRQDLDPLGSRSRGRLRSHAHRGRLGRALLGLTLAAVVIGCSSEAAKTPSPTSERPASARADEPRFALEKARVLDLTYPADVVGPTSGTALLVRGSTPRLRGPAWVLDARVACAKDRDHRISMADLAASEAANGPIPEHAFVLVRTGWGRYWPSRLSYLGDEKHGHPKLDPELAKFFVERKARAIGIDTANPGDAVARFLVVKGHVPVFVNVANLDALPPSGAWIVAAPEPTRLLALAPERTGPIVLPTDEASRARTLELLSALAPSEAAIEGTPSGITAQIAPMFLRDPRREVELEARLERAVFMVRFLEKEGLGAWNAPVWPLSKAHELEHGTPDERIARYEAASRDAWQKPDAVVKALSLKEDAVCVDVGVGSGYFARRLAKACPKGRTIGLDIEPHFVAYVNDLAKKESLPLEARLVLSDDPGLAPASVDLVLIVDTYHHLPVRKAYLAKLRAALKPGGRVVVIDFKKGSKMGPPDEHKLTIEKVVEDAKAAGLKLSSEHDLLTEQFFIELAAP